jgi:hypothetical protein
MNPAQEIFTLFFALYFATVLGLTGRLEPFDTASMFMLRVRAWLRFFVSVVLIILLPVLYFVWIYHRLQIPSCIPITFWNMLALVALSLCIFGFYRFSWGVLLIKIGSQFLFYGAKLPQSLEERIKSHSAGEDTAKRVLPHLIPGAVWVLLTVAFGYCWTRCWVRPS